MLALFWSLLVLLVVVGVVVAVCVGVVVCARVGVGVCVCVVVGVGLFVYVAFCDIVARVASQHSHFPSQLDVL